MSMCRSGKPLVRGQGLEESYVIAFGQLLLERAAPIDGQSGLVLSTRLTYMMLTILSGATMYVLTNGLTKNRYAALIAAACYQFGWLRLVHLPGADGHTRMW